MSRRKGRGPTPRREWQPLEHRGPWVRKIADDDDREFAGELWTNDRFAVVVRRSEDVPDDIGIVLPEGWLWLNVVPRTKGAGAHLWRDFQRIKTEIAGPEREAVEVYPAESRLIDTSNAWHLWVAPEGMSMGFGLFRDRLVYEVPGDRETVEATS